LRVRRGHVKFNVRQHALRLRAFTVADMVRVTNLNAESVRTELQHMREEGLLTAQPSPTKSGKRGGLPTLYRLTDDPEARSALAQSLEAFSPPRPPGDRPTSPHYLSARQLLNHAQTTAARHREPLLAEAEQGLVMAAQAEGGNRASERVRAYLAYEEARLAYLRGAYEEAKQRVAALRECFVGLHDETMLRHLEELRLCLEAQDRFAAQRPSNGGEVAWADCLLDTLADNAYQPESSLTALVLDLLCRLVRTTAPERMQMFLYGELPMLQPQPTAEMTKTQTSIAQRVHKASLSLAIVLPRAGDEAASHLQNARTAFQSERYNDALDAFSRAMALAPSDALPVAGQGETYWRMQRYADALAAFNRAIELDPAFSWAIASRGQVYWALGRPAEALAAFNQAIELDPAYSWAIARQGQVYRLLGRYDEALADFNRAMALAPSDAWPVAERGQVYRLLGRYDEALADFNRAIFLDPDYAWPVAERGQVYRLLGRYDEALADFNRAIFLDPDYAWPVVGRGQVYRQMRHYDTARADFERAQAIYPIQQALCDLEEKVLAIIPADHPQAQTLRDLRDQWKSPEPSWETTPDFALAA
jgi:tetratricopeptide (TPR) repeat protein